MSERLQPQVSGTRSARRRSRAGGIWGSRTIPAATAEELAAESGPTLFGLPAEYAQQGDTPEQPVGDAERGHHPAGLGLVTLRRADRFGAGALVLAGVAANVSLVLSWSPGQGPTGLSLVQRGVEGLGLGAGEWALGGIWQPFAVVLSGGLLVLLGFLLLIPARAHRLVGVLALVVALAAATALVLLMADGGWGADQFGAGMWCAVAVPVLGALGALKAMLTAPLLTVGPPPPAVE